jgi:phenylalanyl-tRNA synthetase alpha subunit
MQFKFENFDLKINTDEIFQSYPEEIKQLIEMLTEIDLNISYTSASNEDISDNSFDNMFFIVDLNSLFNENKNDDYFDNPFGNRI